MPSVLSVDIGTTAVKSAVIDSDGRIAAVSVNGYKTNSAGGCIEQNPEDWWNAFLSGLSALEREAEFSSIEAIVLSGQMQDLICLNGTKTEGSAILYSDTRAETEWVRVLNELGAERYSAITKNTGGPSSLPAKIIWLINNLPEIVRKDSIFLLGAHDYLCWKLTGIAVTDYTNASATGLLNFDSDMWDDEILSLTGISAGNLPELVGADLIVGKLKKEIAEQTGLPPGLPVIHGAGDAASSTVGAGAGDPGTCSIYLGTSGWVASTSECAAEVTTGIFNLKHPDPAKIINVGPMLLTGGNVEWCIRTILSESGHNPTKEDFSKYTSSASKAAAGSGGVFYLPYLTGERSPFNDPDARGAFIGLTKSAGRNELSRSVFEGISYSLKWIMQSMGLKPDTMKIHLSGGGAGNRLWAEILASVLNTRMSVLANSRESGVIGNTVIAGKALGWFDSLNLPASFSGIERSYDPAAPDTAVYKSGYEIFRKLYPALKNSFGEISSLNLY